MGLYGFLLASRLVSLILFLTTYGVLAGAQAHDYKEASRIRMATLGHNILLEANLNFLAFSVAQGTVVGFALTLAAKPLLRRNVLLSLCAFCLIRIFFPVSRSGVDILFLSSGAAIYAKGLTWREHSACEGGDLGCIMPLPFPV